MSSLADYLSKNYLSADPNPAKKSKKRKRKDVEASSSGLIIADDDVSGWDNAKSKDDADDEGIMVTCMFFHSVCSKPTTNKCLPV
jgi:pre-mRNA-splicing factor CWC26